MRLGRWILHALGEDDTMRCPDFNFRSVVHCSLVRHSKATGSGHRLTDHPRRANTRVLHRWRPTEVQRNHLIPEITTPEKTVPDLNVLVIQLRGTRVFSTVDRDPQIVQQSERHPAIQPCLSSIAPSTFLCTEKQQRLNRRDARISNFQRVMDARDGTLEELCTAIE